MCYQIEKFHDQQLIDIVNELNNEGKLEIFSDSFDLPNLGELVCAQRRRPFDVELSFENLSVIVETKVDSDEGSRWDNTWQTQQIVQITENLDYLNETKRYFYITYGTSEFYTKQKENGDGLHKNGPYSNQFEHITLDRMIEFVESADLILPESDTRTKWLRMMRIEQEKRKLAGTLLTEFSNFRRMYLQIQNSNENDFPRTRFLYCGPELAFPVMFKVLELWNNCDSLRWKFGQLDLFPVGRISPSIHDSILNFCGLYFTNEEQSLTIYMEVNEDFNLNIKVTWEDNAQEDQIEDLIEQVQNMLDTANWPDFVRTKDRNYSQGESVQAVFELDFGFLEHAENIDLVVQNLSETVEVVKTVLAEEFNVELCTQ